MMGLTNLDPVNKTNTSRNIKPGFEFFYWIPKIITVKEVKTFFFYC